MLGKTEAGWRSDEDKYPLEDTQGNVSEPAMRKTVSQAGYRNSWLSNMLSKRKYDRKSSNLYFEKTKLVPE